MSWNLVQLGRVASAPWHNGGGVTRELLAWPPGRDWTVRLSVAEVARDGPFSRLPGVSGACSQPCKASALVAACANEHAATASWGSERQGIAPNTLAWRILDSDGLVQLAGDDALWMEIEP